MFGWWYHLKHVEHFPDINKLCNVASCWIYIGILLGAHPILHISRIRVNTAICHVCIRGSGGTTPRTQSPHWKRLGVQQHDPVTLRREGTVDARDGSRNKGRDSTAVTLERGDLTLGSIAREHVAPLWRIICTCL
jgi:hypothetical protein